jgi:anti-sigma factor RsiW
MDDRDATLWKLLDGELSAAEADAIEAAAAADPGLRRRLEELSAQKQAVLAGAPRPPPGFAARVVAKAARLAPAPVLDLEDARRLLRRALVAAVVLAAVGLTFFVLEVLPTAFEPIHAENPLLRGEK